MSKKEKLIERLKRIPKDFTFDETCTLLESCGYIMSNKGKTSGSRVKFYLDKKVYTMHKPHPRNIINEASMNNILEFLIDNNYITK